MRHNLVLRSPTLWHVTQTQVYTGSLHSSRRSPLIPPYVQLRQSPSLSPEACDHVNHSYSPPATHKRPSLCPRLCQSPSLLMKHIPIELTVLYVNYTVKQVLKQLSCKRSVYSQSKALIQFIHLILPAFEPPCVTCQ